MRRLFFALWPDVPTREALLCLQDPLEGRKLLPQDLHLTLAFLGAQPADLLPALQTILQDLKPVALELCLDRIGYFPNSRIAWAGMASAPAGLISLHEALLAKLNRAGIDGAARGAFTPHVTLARNAPPPQIRRFEPIHWQASHLALVESLSPCTGVRYRQLGWKEN